MLLKLHRQEEAGPLIESLVQERSGDPEVLVLSARLALNSNRSGDALRDLEQVLALDPDRREALFLRAQCHFRAGRTTEALADVDRALAIDPNDLGALNLLASVQSALGQKEEAAATVANRRKVEERTAMMADASEKIAANPDDPDLRCRLGELAAQAGLVSLAAQSYEVALLIDPKCENARRSLRALGLRVPGQHAAEIPDDSSFSTPQR